MRPAQGAPPLWLVAPVVPVAPEGSQLKPDHTTDDDATDRVAQYLAVHGHYRRSDGTISLYVGAPDEDAKKAVEIPYKFLSPSAPGQLSELLLSHGHLGVFQHCSRAEVAAWLIQAAQDCDVEVIDRPGVHAIVADDTETRVLVTHGRALAIGGDEEIGARIKLVGRAAAVPEVKGTAKRLNRDLAPVLAANHRLLVIVCFALVAPLLELFGRRPLGLLLIGQTSKGKSIVQQFVQNIVNGAGRVEPLNATRVGLHDFLTEQGGFAVFLEDVHNSEYFGALLDAIMDAGNGGGRMRARSVSRGVPPPTVNSTLIMSSEFNLADTARRARHRLNGGAYARVFELHLGEHGVFDDLCERESGAVLAAELVAAGNAHRGVLGRAFFEAVASRWAEVQALHAKHTGRVRQAIAEAAQGGELTALNSRLLDGLAFAAMAGAVASKLGVLDVRPGQVVKAFRLVFREHLGRQMQGATPVAKEVVEAVRHYLQVYRRRFPTLSSAGEASDREGIAGFRRRGKSGTEYLFFPGTFRKTFVDRFGQEAFTHLREAGHLTSNESRHNLTMVRMPARGDEAPQRQDFVIIHESILASEKSD